MSADPANQTPCTLQRVGNGDRSAIAECLQYYGGLVWSIARRLSPNKEDAEDAVQDIFFDLWRNAGRFDPEQGSEKVFITMIARRRLIDRLRAHERRALVESLPDDITAVAVNLHFGHEFGDGKQVALRIGNAGQ